MFGMKKFPALVLILLAACGPMTPTAVSTNPISVDESTPVPQVVIPTVMMLPTAAGAPEATASLWLQILAPLDEAVVNFPQVDVTGSAQAGTVISINELILIVDSDQQFTATVTLEEGPNLIEIIASDADGNELFALLTITYEP